MSEVYDIKGCPQFSSFLYDCWGQDPEYHNKIRALREALHATLCGTSMYFRRAILLCGEIASGKTQLLRIIRALAPTGSVSEVSPRYFSNAFEVARLNGKVANIYDGLSKFDIKTIRSEKLVSFINGDIQLGCTKGEPPFQFRPECVHWFALDQGLKLADDLSTQLIILKFNHRYPETSRVTDIGDKIATAEVDEILAWVKGARS